MQLEYRIFTFLFIVAFCLFYLFLFINPGIQFLQNDPKAMDFLAFYTGGKLLSLSSTNLYNLQLQHVVQQQIDPITKTNGIFLPFLNPPFVALLFQVIAIFGFIKAYVILLGINIVLLLVICMTSIQLIKERKWYYTVLFIICVTTFIPILITLLVGQLSIFLCTVFLFAWLLIKNKQEFRSGFVLSLILIKPHFFLLPFLAILVQRRRKQIAGFIFGSAILVVISLFYVGWTGINNYVVLLNSFYKTGTGYNINLMAQQSIQTLLLIIFHTRSLDQIRFYWALANLSIIIPTLFIWSKKASFSSPQLAFQFALLIIATLLTSPHTHFYDLSLLLIVAILLLTQLNKIKQGQKKLFIVFIIFSYFIPLGGYCLFVWLPDATQGIWVVPSVVYLIIFWVILVKELVNLSKNATLH